MAYQFVELEIVGARVDVDAVNHAPAVNPVGGRRRCHRASLIDIGTNQTIGKLRLQSTTRAQTHTSSHSRMKQCRRSMHTKKQQMKFKRKLQVEDGETGGRVLCASDASSV